MPLQLWCPLGFGENLVKLNVTTCDDCGQGALSCGISTVEFAEDRLLMNIQFILFMGDCLFTLRTNRVGRPADVGVHR